MRAAYQGEPGAYSEEALALYFGASAATVPCPTFSDVFDALEENEADVAVLPFENSYAGDVGEVYDQFRQRKIWIHDELALPVRHHLLVKPGTTMDELVYVRSHPQALAQCRDFIRRNRLVIDPVHDTAAAARLVSELEGREVAAIASRRAAEHYGLEILKSEIQDSDDNTTRFYIVSMQRPDVRPQPAPSAEPYLQKQPKTCLLFAVHDKPGALYRCLGVFAEHEINLTKLTSRPHPGLPWNYMFFADLVGHLDQPEVQAALAELRSHTTTVRVLGSFPVQEPSRYFSS